MGPLSAPRLVGARRWRSVVSVLGAGRVVAVPGDGAYQLAVSPAHRNALAVLWARTAPPGDATPVVAIGRHAQVVELAPEWSRETTILTDRMWPGPLTVLVPAGESILAWPDEEEPVLALSMPSSRALRALCRASGPLVVVALQWADGDPVTAADEVAALFSADDIGCVLDTGRCRGAGPTVVDCTVSPPIVQHVGALPQSYVDAALMMSNRKRRWLSNRTAPGLDPR